MGKKNKALTLLTVFLAAAVLAACGKEEASQEPAAKDPAAQEAEGTEAAEKVLEEGTRFVSADGRIRLTMPAQDWVCTTDVEGTKTFTSDTAVINIICAEGEGIRELMVPGDQEAYRQMVNGGMAELTFEVMDFSAETQGEVAAYTGTVHYTDPENPDRYVTHRGIYGPTGGWTATAVLFEEDTRLLSDIQEALAAMQVEMP